MSSAQPHTDYVRKWAHDVRNTMNSLRLCTSAIKVVPAPKERLELLDQIGIAANRMVTLLDETPAGIEESHEARDEKAM